MTTQSMTVDELAEACAIISYPKNNIASEVLKRKSAYKNGFKAGHSFRDAEVKKLEDMLRVAIDALELYTGRPFIDRPALEAIANIREMKINKEKT